MKNLLHGTGAAITAALATLVMLTLASTAMARPYASGIQLNGTNSSFVLNEDADNVDILYDGGATTVHMGGLLRGTHTFDATLGTTWQIVVTKSAPLGWIQISTDQTTTSFWSPLGVSINKDPASSNFGNVYVSNASGGTTPFGRTTTSGIYVLNALAQDLGLKTGGVDWAAAGNSAPFKSTIGPDGHLYVADFSNDLVYEFNDDMSVATPLIDASNKTSGQYVESIHVEGTQAGGDRKIYLVNSHYLDARRGLISYDLGANATATPSDTGTQVIGPDYFAFYPQDVARDSNGDWYMNQYRYMPDQAPAISKFDGSETLPINTALWETAGTYTGADGMDISENTGLVAYGDYYTGKVYLFDMATGAYVDSFDAGTHIRELAFDAAGNLVTGDNDLEQVRFWSPGGYTEATTGSDGSFFMGPQPSVASIVLNTNDSGLGSLRYIASMVPSGTTIIFTNTLSGQTILLTSGQILVTNHLTIDASSLPEGVILNANTNSRIFEFASDTTNTLTGLTLTNGRVSGSPYPDNEGGAIFMHIGSVLTINNSTLSGNSADAGGGIFMEVATLTLNNATLSGNSADLGGGIFIYDGTLTLNNTTLSGNSAATWGGAIRNWSGTLTLNNTTLSGNSADGLGGGIHNYDGTITLNNTTLSGNSAEYGGGIFNDHVSTLTLNNATLSGNFATNNGGGIFNLSGTLMLTNTIVATNTAPGAPLYANIYGSFSGANNLTSGDPLLAPLGDYGGPTQTMPPLPGSPAINAGTNIVSLPTYDQRGYPRVVNGVVDIGAVEYQGASEATIYTDTAGELFSGVTGDGILDITAAAVSHTVLNITFQIFLAGDPTAKDWGKYMVAIHSESGGDTTSNAWLRPIGMDVGMNYWLGAWLDYDSAVQAWHYTNSGWVQVGGSVPNGGEPPVPGLTVAWDSHSVTITSPLGLLGLRLGDTIQFDIYTSGSYPDDGAIDALANPAQTVTNWGQYYNSGTNLLTYTLEGVRLIIVNNGDGTITLYWPLWASDYFLEWTPILGADASWNLVFDMPVVDGAYYRLTLPITQGSRYYRLSQ